MSWMVSTNKAASPPSPSPSTSTSPSPSSIPVSVFENLCSISTKGRTRWQSPSYFDCTERTILKLHETFDTDGDGGIDFRELLAGLKSIGFEWDEREQGGPLENFVGRLLRIHGVKDTDDIEISPELFLLIITRLKLSVLFSDNVIRENFGRIRVER